MTRAFASGVVLILCTACGSEENGRVPVKGTVTYDGAPVEWGSIALRPTRDTQGPAAGTDIVDGRFAISASEGPATGAYTARITIVEQDAPEPASPMLSKGPGNMKSLEVAIEIEADREEYEFKLPLPAD